MQGFNFEHPWVLSLLLLFLVCRFFCKAKYERFFIPHLSLVSRNHKIQDRLLPLLQWLGVIFLLLSLASPVQNRGWAVSESQSVDIVLALDLSGSMRYPINSTQTRFDALIEVVSEFIKNHRGDRIGVVSFGSFSAVTVPLTFDTRLAMQMLQKLFVGAVGERTALYDSIFETYLMLEDSTASSKVVILFTDGINNEGSTPYDVIKEIVLQSDIILYTVGFGVVDELELKELAMLGNGQYFKAENKEQLRFIYESIDRLEKSKVEGEMKMLKSYYFVFTLFLSLLSFLLYLYLKNQRGLQ